MVQPPPTRDALVLHLQRDLREMSRDDPYAIYWSCADQIADPDSVDREILRSGMVELADPRRLRFLAWRVVDRSAQDGNTCTRTEVVISGVRSRSACERDLAIAAIVALVETGVFVAYRDRDRVSWLYLRQLDTAEDRVACFVQPRLCQP